MRAGDLRHPVVIQRWVTQQDPETGEQQEGVWVEFSKAWASIEALSARDLVAAQAVQSEISSRIVIRYQAGVLPAMRVLYRDMIYNIQGPPLPDRKSGLDYLTLVVSAGVNDG